MTRERRMMFVRVSAEALLAPYTASEPKQYQAWVEWLDPELTRVPLRECEVVRLRQPTEVYEPECVKVVLWHEAFRLVPEGWIVPQAHLVVESV